MAGQTSADIDRVKQDLTAIQDAIGTDYPFGWVTVAAWLAIAVVSGIGAIAAWTGSAAAGAITALLALAVVAAVVSWTMSSRGARAAGPGAWREVRRLAAAKLLVGPALLVFVAWQLYTGADPIYLISSTAFIAGILVTIYATTRPSRLAGLGVGLPLLAFGALVPIIPPDNLALGAACTGVTAGLSCAAIITAQLRAAR
jgi:hypothetical protein